MENVTTSLPKEIADTAIVLPKLQARTAGTTPLQARHRWIEEDMYSKGMESCVSEGREASRVVSSLITYMKSREDIGIDKLRMGSEGFFRTTRYEWGHPTIKERGR